MLVLFLVGAVVDRRLRHRRQDRRRDLRPVHRRRVSRGAAGRLDRGSADRRAARGARRRLLIALGNALLAASISAARVLSGPARDRARRRPAEAERQRHGGRPLSGGRRAARCRVSRCSTWASMSAAILGPLVTGEAQDADTARAPDSRRRPLHGAGRGAVPSHATPSRQRRHSAPRRPAAPARRHAVGARTWMRLRASPGIGAVVARRRELRLDSVESGEPRAARPPTSSSPWRCCISCTYFFAAGLDREERRRGVVIVVLFVGSALFLSGLRAGRIVAESVRRALHRSRASAGRLRHPDRAGSNRSIRLRHHLRAVLRVALGCAGAAQSQSVGAGEVRASA